jgi:hypothetical protein
MCRRKCKIDVMAVKTILVQKRNNYLSQKFQSKYDQIKPVSQGEQIQTPINEKYRKGEANLM